VSVKANKPFKRIAAKDAAPAGLGNFWTKRRSVEGRNEVLPVSRSYLHLFRQM
jgi:hypothetical protein